MATGTVKWFNAEKGYGFITPDDGGRDLFVHYTGIEGTGYRTLSEGQKVEYEATQGQKGPRRRLASSQASRSSPPRDQVVILPRGFLSTHMRAVTDLSYSSFEFTCTEIPPQDIQCRSRTMRMGGREEALPWGRSELWCWHW